MATGLRIGVPKLREDEARPQQGESVAASPAVRAPSLHFGSSEISRADPMVPSTGICKCPDWENTPETSFPAPGRLVPP